MPLKLHAFLSIEIHLIFGNYVELVKQPALKISSKSTFYSMTHGNVSETDDPTPTTDTMKGIRKNVCAF